MASEQFINVNDAGAFFQYYCLLWAVCLQGLFPFSMVGLMSSSNPLFYLFSPFSLSFSFLYLFSLSFAVNLLILLSFLFQSFPLFLSTNSVFFLMENRDHSLAPNQEWCNLAVWSTSQTSDLFKLLHALHDGTRGSLKDLGKLKAKQEMARVNTGVR